VTELSAPAPLTQNRVALTMDEDDDFFNMGLRMSASLKRKAEEKDSDDSSSEEDKGDHHGGGGSPVTRYTRN
jgi:hypothetical protein